MFIYNVGKIQLNKDALAVQKALRDGITTIASYF